MGRPEDSVSNRRSPRGEGSTLRSWRTTACAERPRISSARRFIVPTLWSRPMVTTPLDMCERIRSVNSFSRSSCWCSAMSRMTVASWVTRSKRVSISAREYPAPKTGCPSTRIATRSPCASSGVDARGGQRGRGGAQHLDLAHEPLLVEGVPQDGVQLAGGEAVRHHEVRRRFLLAGGADGHHERPGGDVAGTAHERAEGAGGTGAVAQDEVDLHQAQRLDGLGVRGRFEDREAAEPAQQART